MDTWRPFSSFDTTGSGPVSAPPGVRTEDALGGPGLARHSDPDTSHAAANADLPKKTSQRRRVLDTHAEHGPMTDDELSSRLPQIRLNSLTTRRSELVARGWLHDTGMRRRTAAGVDAVVWGMSDEARARYGELI